MQIALYDGEFGKSDRYRVFDCCEIDLDSMTVTTDYVKYYEGSDATVGDITFKVRHFSITTTGCASIENPITDDSNAIMASPFWEWDSNLELRNWMGDHYESLNLTEQPDDWEENLYWKYYVRIATTKFVEWKNPTSTTFNSGTTYWTCDDAYAPQKIYYGAGDYAPSFQIGQCLYNPPSGVIPSIGGSIAGATYNGYGCGTNVYDESAGTRRTRLFAYKAPDEEFVGYDGMTAYDGPGIPLHFFPLYDILTDNPARDMSYKHIWQMAHIIYNEKEYIGWGEIKYDYAHPENMQSADFTCVPIELFEGAIDPDPEDIPAYDTGVSAGNDGTAGVGSGLPMGDDIQATELTGVIQLAGTSSNGLHAYIIDSTNLMALYDYLWTPFSLADISQALVRWIFNPFNSVLGLHKLPHVLMPEASSTLTAIRLAGRLCDGEDGDPLIKAYPISHHFASCAADLGAPDYTFTLDLKKERLPYNSFQDFANTNVTLHVPFCGDISIDPDKCIGGKVEVYMQCDALTGSMGVQVKSIDMNKNKHIVGTMTGNCAYHIPISGSEYSFGGAMASLGQMGMSAISGNFLGMLGGATGMLQNRQQTMVSGTLGGNQGWLGFLGMSITVTYTQFVKTGDAYNKVNGRPCADDTRKVKEFTGYSEMKVNTKDIAYANDTEKDRIRQILETGVIV